MNYYWVYDVVKITITILDNRSDVGRQRRDPLHTNGHNFLVGDWRRSRGTDGPKSLMD